MSKLRKSDACVTLMYAVVTHIVKSGHCILTCLDSTSAVGLAVGLVVVFVAVIIIVVVVVVVVLRRRRSRTSRFTHIVVFHLTFNFSRLVKFASNT